MPPKKSRNEILETHAEKNPSQRKKYLNTLTNDRGDGFDSTLKQEEKEEKLEKTGSKELNPPKAKRPKRLRKKVADFSQRYNAELIIALICSVLIGGIFLGYVVPNNREIGQLQTKLDSLAKGIEELKEKYKEDRDTDEKSGQKDDQNLRLEIQRDLDAIRNRIEDLERQLK